MGQYIHQLSDWPHFHWDPEKVLMILAEVRHQQGRFLGHMQAMGFGLRAEAQLESMTLEILKSNEIEGELLNRDEVRSSVARRLGLDVAGLVPSDRQVEGTVDMMMDATQNADQPLTSERLYDWHAALFPTGRSGMYTINVGAWRSEDKGPMQVVSGPIGRERVHFEAPDAGALDAEMGAMLQWFNTAKMDPVLKAGIAHLWFITVHPFDDGNGRIARAIADLQLTRADCTAQRFYSMSAGIQRERNEYYRMLETTQMGTMDITPWLLWFLDCLGRSISASAQTLEKVLDKAKFWDRANNHPINVRQRQMLNSLLDGFEGKLTSSKWAKIVKCSQDTALRDIQDLVEKGLLYKEESGGRSTGYGVAKMG